jgi:hypothetical protein
MAIPEPFFDLLGGVRRISSQLVPQEDLQPVPLNLNIADRPIIVSLGSSELKNQVG